MMWWINKDNGIKTITAHLVIYRRWFIVSYLSTKSYDVFSSWLVMCRFIKVKWVLANDSCVCNRAALYQNKLWINLAALVRDKWTVLVWFFLGVYIFFLHITADLDHNSHTCLCLIITIMLMSYNINSDLRWTSWISPLKKPESLLVSNKNKNTVKLNSVLNYLN